MTRSKHIVIVDGHPFAEGFVTALAAQYKKGAEAGGHEVRLINVRDLAFDAILHKGYRAIQELEPDLKKAQDDVKWAEHIVLLYPVWWGGMPALLKGFFDRALLPGFAFKYHSPGSNSWDKLLKGRTGQIITTMDAPVWYHRFIAGSSAQSTKRSILGFCGIKPICVTEIGPIKTMSENKKEVWKQRTFALGQRGI